MKNELIFKCLKSRTWKKRKDVIKYAKRKGRTINDREIRRFIETFNEYYIKGLNDEYIVNSNKGYKLTNDLQLIDKSIEGFKKQADNMYSKYWRTKKVVKEKKNMKEEFEECKSMIEKFKDYLKEKGIECAFYKNNRIIIQINESTFIMNEFFTPSYDEIKGATDWGASEVKDPNDTIDLAHLVVGFIEKELNEFEVNNG